jgi:hypothetical protein
MTSPFMCPVPHPNKHCCLSVQFLEVAGQVSDRVYRAGRMKTDAIAALAMT